MTSPLGLDGQTFPYEKIPAVLTEPSHWRLDIAKPAIKKFPIL